MFITHKTDLILSLSLSLSIYTLLNKLHVPNGNGQDMSIQFSVILVREAVFLAKYIAIAK